MSPKLDTTPCRCDDAVPVSGGKKICNNLNCEVIVINVLNVRKPSVHPDGLPYCSHMVCPKFNSYSGVCSELGVEPPATCVPATRELVWGLQQSVHFAQAVRDDARRASQRDLELRQAMAEELETVKIVKGGIIERLQGEVDAMKKQLDDDIPIVDYHRPEAAVWAEAGSFAPPTWTCAACGDVHPIDHEGLFCSGCQAMICCSCETKYEPKHNCSYSFRRETASRQARLAGEAVLK